MTPCWKSAASVSAPTSTTTPDGAQVTGATTPSGTPIAPARRPGPCPPERSARRIRVQAIRPASKCAAALAATDPNRRSQPRTAENRTAHHRRRKPMPRNHSRCTQRPADQPCCVHPPETARQAAAPASGRTPRECPTNADGRLRVRAPAARRRGSLLPHGMRRAAPSARSAARSRSFPQSPARRSEGRRRGCPS